MKLKKVLTICTGMLVLFAGLAWETKKGQEKRKSQNLQTSQISGRKDAEEKPCVFMSLMGEQPTAGYAGYKKNENVILTKGENWLANAQNSDGGWGAGSHTNQHEMNPHAVQSDPATTAMAAMALYRCGYTIASGKYQQKLENALDFLLKEVETNRDGAYITKVRGTQIQIKLGENIDAVLTLQFLNQVLPTITDQTLQKRTEEAIQICVDKIEKSYDGNGKVSGAGWAGVLQSSLANSAIEQAEKNTKIKVSKDKLEASRNYQKSNYNAETEAVNTDEGAGVVLYAVSSSVRGSASEAKEAETLMDAAKKSGKIAHNAELNKENLEKIGVTKTKAASYEVADKVYKSAKNKAMREDVMSGFGNNGGEEFLSFLQTGESMVVKKDNDWKTWYNNISGKMIKIQNQDGSWNGHHCITSPVFCTATCLLILSIENDISNLQK